ncbi:fimbria/pilus outer membrane usher protein [Phyllobacterium sp. YR531]|uniref:fimbria/pilus outer membrane usher protein n=1 Tax=Phyllobacterium sp. YR531 TaxID=1144343 RepID=UPI00030413BC|nr:fimbria/pilus outer membrane usher protein [Phyllobacterium sp. YR531]
MLSTGWSQQPDVDAGDSVDLAAPQDGQAQDLYLEVYINDEPTGLIGGFRQLPDGELSAKPDELREVGLKPMDSARDGDGSIRLNRLDNVSYRVEIESQRLYITTDNAARSARMIDVNPKPDKERPEAKSGYGAVLNYSLFASTDNLLSGSAKAFQGVSGGFDARIFSPYGTLNQSFTANVSDGELEGVKRLNTTWSLSDPERLITYRAGDFISGGLPWTRPVYLGGMQIQRNFTLRPDLVTLPVPVLSGTAAVPSTLEVYTQNVRTYSGDVPSGPFEVTNFPVFSGQGEAQIVLRDTLGRETRTTVPFYSSSRLLRKGLWDFSAEVGVARRNFGTESNDYDDDVMGAVTTRYGLSNWLTVEGHFEGGAELLNGGLGLSFPLGAYGVTSLAAAGSSHDGDTGMLLNGSVELTYKNNYTFYGRVQQTFGDYQDIASVTADDQLSYVYGVAGLPAVSTRVPKSLVQATLSVPGPFDRSNMNFSYTQQELGSGEKSTIISASYSQSVFKNSSFFATAFTDLEDSDSFGIFAGLTIPFDNNISVSTGYEQTQDGPSGFAEIAKSEQREEGSYGWRLRTREGETPDRYASASYRGRHARVEGSVQQYDDNVRATAQMEGAIAVAGGGVFATNRIDDAFAIVDAGAPDVDVSYENRPIGRTNRSGRILVPDLRSYEPNTLAIDPANLPVDASIGSTRDIVVPADRSGVVVDFNVAQTTSSALVSIVDASGKPLDAGLSGTVDGGGGEFIVGYDGEAYISSLAAQNSVTIGLADGTACTARFAYQPARGTQVKIKNVVCQ